MAIFRCFASQAIWQLAIKCVGCNQIITGYKQWKAFFNCCNYCNTSSPLLTHPQASRDPLSAEAMNEIFEDVKDMGVLIGKGGVYGQVTALGFLLSLSWFMFFVGQHLDKHGLFHPSPTKTDVALGTSLTEIISHFTGPVSNI